MYLSNIKLWNFRKYGNATQFDLDVPNFNLDFTKGLNILIGENDSGKSAIIDAIKLVLKTHSFDWIKIDQDDFYDGSLRLRIELTLKDLNVEEAKNFIDWLSWTGEGADAECFLRLVLDVKRSYTSNQIFPYEVRAGIDTEGALLNAEAREYLKATYLRPLRDAETELVPKKNSRLSQILQGHDAFKGKKDDHLLIEIFRNFNSSIEKYFEGLDKEGVDLSDLKGRELKREIDGYIQAFYDPNKESLFTVNDSKLKSILERLELSLKDVVNPGLGTLNKLFIASELLHLKKMNWSGLRLGLIEELEAHLHPQAQMQIIEMLQSQDDLQLILTTHSPNLASKVKLANVILCIKGGAYPLGPQFTKLDPENYKFLEKFLDVTKSNLFFAKGIIFVEGWSEEILIPSIASKMGINLTEKGISVINVGNLGFSNYTNIFLRKDPSVTMPIPVAVITDVDVPAYTVGDPEAFPVNKDQLEIDTKEKSALLTARSENNVKFYVAPSWTLEFSLLESFNFSTLFLDTLKEVHTRTDWTTDPKKTLATKLLGKTLKKTEISYLLASKLDIDSKKATPEIILEFPRKGDKPDTMQYLIDAIKYAAGY